METKHFEFFEDEQRLEDLRRAAETHRQVRRFAQQIIRPNASLLDICNKLEYMNRFVCLKKVPDRTIAAAAVHRLPDGREREPRGCALHAQL